MKRNGRIGRCIHVATTAKQVEHGELVDLDTKTVESRLLNLIVQLDDESYDATTGTLPISTGAHLTGGTEGRITCLGVDSIENEATGDGEQEEEQ